MSQTLTLIEVENEYAPDVCSAPGETLQEVLDDRGMTQTALAERLGLSQKTVNEIIRGKAPITHETAIGLETVLGISAGFWNRYEMNYRESEARNMGNQRLSNSIGWLNQMQWKEPARKGWIRTCKSLLEQVMEVLRFFGVASPKQYEEIYGNLSIQWKRSPKFPIDKNATAFWLRKGEIEAQKLVDAQNMMWGPYDARKFELCLVEIRKLTLNVESDSFVPELQRICALAGVVVVFVPEIKGTHVGGATRWLSPDRALIQLSLRHKSNDQLWFHFFHEAAHVLKHSKKRLFVDSEDQIEDDQYEREANGFAESVLIPSRDFNAFVKSGQPTKAGIEAFAANIGTHPGIVVGRLQKENVIQEDRYNDLKQMYVWQFE